MREPVVIVMEWREGKLVASYHDVPISTEDAAIRREVEHVARRKRREVVDLKRDILTRRYARNLKLMLHHIRSLMRKQMIGEF